MSSAESAGQYSSCVMRPLVEPYPRMSTPIRLNRCRSSGSLYWAVEVSVVFRIEDQRNSTFKRFVTRVSRVKEQNTW